MRVPASERAQGARRQVLSFAFNHDRPAFKGPGQIPLAEAINWAVDRRAMVAARGYLGGKRTDQILPAAMTRPAALYALGSLDIAGACKK